MLQAIGVMTSSELREAGEPIGDSLDQSEPRRARTNCGKKCRQDRRSGFVTPVTKEAGKADAEDCAVQPGLFFWAVSHARAVYRRRRMRESSEQCAEWPTGWGVDAASRQGLLSVSC